VGRSIPNHQHFKRRPPLRRAAFVKQSLADVFRWLARESHLTGTSLDTFIDRSAFYFGEINAAHPFREGNGRTQREYLRHLGVNAGFLIDWSLTSPIR
jgi:cell filamentation protein